MFCERIAPKSVLITENERVESGRKVLQMVEICDTMVYLCMGVGLQLPFLNNISIFLGTKEVYIPCVRAGPSVLHIRALYMMWEKYNMMGVWPTF